MTAQEPSCVHNMSPAMWLSIRRQATLAALQYRTYPNPDEMLAEVGLTWDDVAKVQMDVWR